VEEAVAMTNLETLALVCEGGGKEVVALRERQE
jgi:hypothetical protein